MLESPASRRAGSLPGSSVVLPSVLSLSHQPVLVRHRYDGRRMEDVTVNERDVLAERFEHSRSHLRGVAYRMLGSLSEADDAVQEAWLKLNRSDVAGVENLTGWLTTVVARVCLDMLRTRKARHEEP